MKIYFKEHLVKSDEKLLHIEELIKLKRQMLIDKQKKLKFIIKQNSFLDTVKSDYITYYNYISQQKKDQIKALELLNQYVEDLSISGELTKRNIQDSTFEKKKIRKEIKLIKKGLDDIVNNTNNINFELK